jgi:hypothetical protein
MSNAEPSSVPAPTGPRALLRVEALPSERHPAAVYLASLGSGSRRTMRQSLGVIAEIVGTLGSVLKSCIILTLRQTRLRLP